MERREKLRDPGCVGLILIDRARIDRRHKIVIGIICNSGGAEPLSNTHTRCSDSRLERLMRVGLAWVIAGWSPLFASRSLLGSGIILGIDPTWSLLCCVRKDSDSMDIALMIDRL